MRASILVLVLAALVLAVWGCAEEDPCEGVVAVIEANPGLDLCSDRIGPASSQEAVEQALGAPATSLDLGALGRRAEHPEEHLSVRYDAEGVVLAIDLYEGFEGKTAEGIGLGSDEASVRAALGEPDVRPFLSAWWYPERGLALQLREGVVVSLHLFAP